MARLLRRPGFGLLFAGGLVSAIGDWLLFVALPFYVFELTGSNLATGAMFVAQTLPGAALGTVAGVFVDRWDRVRTMVVTDSLRVILLLAILLVREPNQMWIIYAVTFAQTSIGLLFNPARNAVIPDLVPDDELVPANSLISSGGMIAQLVGPGLGAVLTPFVGLSGVVMLDSATFAFSAVMALLIGRSGILAGRWRPATESNLATLGRSRRGPRLLAELSDGLALARANRLIGVLLLVLGLFATGQGIVVVLLVPFVKTILGGDTSLFGVILATQGLGGLVGALVVGRSRLGTPPRRLVTIGLLGLGLLVVALMAAPGRAAALAIIGLTGAAAIAFFVGRQTLLHRHVADSFRGRVFGLSGTVQSLMLSVGLGAAALLVSEVGLARMFDLAALFFVAGALTAGVGLRSVDRSATTVGG